jgi:hypothetical protein
LESPITIPQAPLDCPYLVSSVDLDRNEVKLAVVVEIGHYRREITKSITSVYRILRVRRKAERSITVAQHYEGAGGFGRYSQVGFAVVVELATARSSFPSPLKSPTAAATGEVPKGKFVGPENWTCPRAAEAPQACREKLAHPIAQYMIL